MKNTNPTLIKLSINNKIAVNESQDNEFYKNNLVEKDLSYLINKHSEEKKQKEKDEINSKKHNCCQFCSIF